EGARVAGRVEPVHHVALDGERQREVRRHLREPRPRRHHQRRGVYFTASELHTYTRMRRGPALDAHAEARLGAGVDGAAEVGPRAARCASAALPMPPRPRTIVSYERIARRSHEAIRRATRRLPPLRYRLACLPAFFFFRYDTT